MAAVAAAAPLAAEDVRCSPDSLCGGAEGHGKPLAETGTTMPGETPMHGGTWSSGRYSSTGAAPTAREEDDEEEESTTPGVDAWRASSSCSANPVPPPPTKSSVPDGSEANVQPAAQDARTPTPELWPPSMEPPSEQVAAPPAEPDGTPPPLLQLMRRRGDGDGPEESEELQEEVKRPEEPKEPVHVETPGPAGRLQAWRQRCPQLCLELLVRRPLWIFLGLQVFSIGLSGALYKGGQLNTDFGAFTRANSNASLSRDVYTHAWMVSSYSPMPQTERKLQSQQEVLHAHNIVNIIYHQEEGKNILEEERLFAVLQFEKRLQALPGWREACRSEIALTNTSGQAGPELYGETRANCDPGESLVTYAWPERPLGTNQSGGSTSRLTLSGKGNRLLPLEASIASLRDQRTFFNAIRRFLPKDFAPPDGGARAHSDLLQSHFLFSFPYGPAHFGVPYRTATAAGVGFDRFLEDVLHPVLLDGDEGLKAQGIRAYYHSAELDRLDLFEELAGDLRLSLGGLAVVVVLVRLHTQSWILSLAGLLLVLESVPMGYVFFKRLSGLEDVSIVNCISIFVIIGIGSDLVFVLTDGWRQSGVLPPSSLWRKGSPEAEVRPSSPSSEGETSLLHQQRLQRRLVWLWSNAGTSCMTTTLCSSSSFLVNLGSVLMPLREFGLFMGLCVIFSLLLQLSMYPLVLIALEKRRVQSTWPQEEGRHMSAIVPHGEPQGEPPRVMRRGSHDDLKTRSVVIRFLGLGWSDFIRAHRRKILACFLAMFMACIIGIPLSIRMDSGIPDVFPDDHNQVAGKRHRERFQSPMTGIASSSASFKASVCDVTSPRAETDFSQCVDKHESCGTWSAVGYCRTRASTLTDICKRSCGFCGYCLARWCSMDSPPKPSRTSPGRCECFEETNTTTGTPAPTLLPGQGETTRVQALIVGYPAEAWNDLKATFTPHFRSLARAPELGERVTANYIEVSGQQGSQGASGWLPGQGWLQPPLVQEHWRSGSVSTWPSFEAPTYEAVTAHTGTYSPSIVRERTVRQYCYCDGITPCSETGHARGVVQHPLSGPGDLMAQAIGSVRRLQDPPPDVVDTAEEETMDAVAKIQRWPGAPPRRLAFKPAEVHVIHGLEIEELGPFELFVDTSKKRIWHFDGMFEPGDPWAQRSMMRMYETLPAGLRVNDAASSKGMWLAAFEAWLLQTKNEEFPARDFHVRIEEFIQDNTDYKRHFLRETNGRVRAVMAEFKLDLGAQSSLGPALDAMRAWDDHVASQNSGASLRAGRAWHSSPLWVRVEAQDGIISSTVTIVLISVAAGSVAILFFTRNCLLMVLSMLSAVLIVLSLLFFMVAIMQWKIGPIEVVALIVFLGYIFTFNLHIAHSYIHAALTPTDRGHMSASDFVSEKRFRMARFALVSMGQSLLGSAMTSVGCALFLVFCTLQFFVRFGLVILLVTLLSLVYSLLFLPAILMLCGPVRAPACCGLHMAPTAATSLDGERGPLFGEADHPRPLLPKDDAFGGDRGVTGAERQGLALELEDLADQPEPSPRLNPAEEEEEV